jgi:hypothetical protein
MRITLLLIVLVWLQMSSASAAALLNVDAAKLFSRADITYDKPASRSEEGLPVGNGRMGSLVWTIPSAIKFQINRADVFAQDSTTTSFPRADSDYGCGCGFVDINLVDAGDDVFAGADFRQHLSVYDGLMSLRGGGVAARVLAWHARDVIAVEIDDQRAQPCAINIDLRMLRYMMQVVNGKNAELAKAHSVLVQTAEHSAASRLEVRGQRILLTQEFRERTFYGSSAVAIGVVGRAAKARYLNESSVQLSAAPGRGRFVILISSAASLSPKQDIGDLALAELESAADKSFADLAADNAAWWRDFWARGFVSLHSDDGRAETVEQNYTYFLYIMASSSRGAYPPRFGGMLWNTCGDMRRWGSQYWWANTAAYYNGLMPAGRVELMDPMFSLYSGMADTCALAARQQWGSQGIWIPETVPFNGPEELPEDIAAEMRDLYLMKKPWEQRSDRFRRYAETKQLYDSRWNFQTNGHFDHGHWIVPDKNAGPFGHTSHILADSAKIATLFWDRYQYTMDQAWLRDRAYPMIKGAAEFYRNFPNVMKGEDGKYHINHVNNWEGSWNSSDTPMELSAMHTIFPIAVRAAKILKVDSELQPIWQKFEEDLAAVPARAGRIRLDFGGFVSGNSPATAAATPDEQLKARFMEFSLLGGFTDPQGIGGAQIFRNRLRLREGPGAIDCEHLGGLALGVHSALLSSEPPNPEGAPLIQVFSAWPRDWDARYTLLAKGNFLVTASQQKGNIEFVEVLSHSGENCTLKNPWGNAAVDLYRNGKKSQNLSNALLNFQTVKGEDIVVLPAGATADQFKHAVP